MAYGYGMQSSTAPIYDQSYSDNLARYNQIVAGYQGSQAQFGQTTGAINQGYGQMVNDARSMGGLQVQNAARSGAQSLQSSYANALNSGIGGSAVYAGLANQGGAATMQNQLQAQQATQQQVMAAQGQQLGYQAQAQQGLAGLQSQQYQTMAGLTNRLPQNMAQYGYGNGGGGNNVVQGDQGQQGMYNPWNQYGTTPQMAPSGQTGGNYVGGGGWGAAPGAPFVAMGSGNPYERLGDGSAGGGYGNSGYGGTDNYGMSNAQDSGVGYGVA